MKIWKHFYAAREKRMKSVFNGQKLQNLHTFS